MAPGTSVEPGIRQMIHAWTCKSRTTLPVCHRRTEHPQIPDDITRVTEAELRADLTTFLDCVAFAEDELYGLEVWRSVQGWGAAGLGGRPALA